MASYHQANKRQSRNKLRAKTVPLLKAEDDASNLDKGNLTPSQNPIAKQDELISGQPPSTTPTSRVLTAKQPLIEKSAHQSRTDCRKTTCINSFTKKKKKPFISGGESRKIVERWGKMWESALSDRQYDRIVFEHNPTACQSYKLDNERINDGCRKLWSIAKMNQNIVTTMMKKFVSGPPSKLFTLNRIEAARCWNRIIDERGLVGEQCCVDLPIQERQKYDIPSLKIPRPLRRDPGVLRKSDVYRFPEELQAEYAKKSQHHKLCYSPSKEVVESKKRNSKYWLDPTLVPPVPEGFREEEFELDPKDDPTGEIRRELTKAKVVAQRYTRFAHIIEKSKQIVPNIEKVNKLMDANYVDADPLIRRQTLLQNFFSSQKIETSPDFKRDAIYATILSRNDNPREAAAKKQFPYNLAEFSKSKVKR